MTRRRASTKRRKTAISPTPSVQSPAAAEEVIGDKVNELSPAANAIGCSVDLLTQILILLPAKSLIRFKCVSKHWLSLISDSQFAHNHSSRNPRPSISALYFYTSRRLNSLPLRGQQNLPSLAFIYVLGCERSIGIVDSSNGLLLCKNLDLGEYIVCNVSTQKYRILPKPSESSSSFYLAFLAFDPSKSPHYNVVLFSYASSPPYKIHVFSSQSGDWKQVFTQQTCKDPGVYWNGAIHWVGDENVRLRFDINAGEMIAIPNPIPPKLLTRDKIRYFGVCGGSLFLIQTRSDKALGFRILRLCNNWLGSYQVNLRPIISAFPEIQRTFKFEVLSMLCDGNGEKKEDFSLVLAIPGRIIAYNLHWKTCDEICNLLEDEYIGFNWYCYAYPLIETLSPV